MEKPRILITTDMECDDMNSMIHLALHLDELDVCGIVYTASKYHFQGDGIHTLGDVTPHYSCSGLLAYEGHIGYPHPDPDARFLKSYRPFEEGWIESLWKNEYAAVYPNLKKHSPDYPSPEYLLSITKTGNIAFEGDVRFETEGSRFIEQLILDDDERTLYLLSWGGINTIVRALMSIHEKYHDSEEWNGIYAKVIRKCCVLGVMNGVGQDNSWLDHGKDLFPDLKMLRSEFVYGGFLSSLTTQADAVHTYRAPWLKENIKFGHGPLMEKTILFADGTYIEGEPENRQYGLITEMDWGFDSMPVFHFDPYDWIGEGDSATVVPLLPHGLRGPEDGRFGSIGGRLFNDGETPEKTYDRYSGKEGNENPFLMNFQHEWAQRADWCIRPYEECVHPPVVNCNCSDLRVPAGSVVDLSAGAYDPDGRQIRTLWDVYRSGCTYHGSGIPAVWNPLDQTTKFTVPADAQPGDFFVLVFSAQACAEHPITRYAEIGVTVTDK
ncbi:MAG: DUF1593 domain-containing protein [Erysipelotrichaceae bacterium]|nr:DUF1593 domain-containing protein [Erysipelotrichaceae bacterium]